MQSQPHRAQVARLSQTQPGLGDPNSRAFSEKGTRPEEWEVRGWGVTGLEGLAAQLSSAVLAPAVAPMGSPGCGDGPTCSSRLLLHPPPCIQTCRSSLTGQARAACDREGAGSPESWAERGGGLCWLEGDCAELAPSGAVVSAPTSFQTERATLLQGWAKETGHCLQRFFETRLNINKIQICLMDEAGIFMNLASFNVRTKLP